MENISKIVLSRKSGKKIGYVLDLSINFEDMRKVGYYIVDEESESEFLLRENNVLSVSENFILIEDEGRLEIVTEKESLFGKEILDEHCLSYGCLNKIIFKKGKIDRFITEKCEILPKNMVFCGTDVIFVEFKKKRKRKNNSNFPRLMDERIVKLQTTQQILLPEKIRLSANFYVGKVSTEDIMGYNNEKIIQKGEIITRLTVEKAKRHNKLNQLFFAIKR